MVRIGEACGSWVVDRWVWSAGRVRVVMYDLHLCGLPQSQPLIRPLPLTGDHPLSASLPCRHSSAHFLSPEPLPNGPQYCPLAPSLVLGRHSMGPSTGTLALRLHSPRPAPPLYCQCQIAQHWSSPRESSDQLPLKPVTISGTWRQQRQDGSRKA